MSVWHDPAGPAALLAAFHGASHDSRPPEQGRPALPSIFEDVVYAFPCACGRTWSSRTSATLKAGEVRAPRQQCKGDGLNDFGCGKWTSGILGPA